jgi:murein DD-endopeptidase / murein LD-carboxypeptidase
MRLMLKKGIYLIILLAVSQLFNTSCTKRIQPESSPRNIPGKAENKNLKDISDIKVEKAEKTLREYHPEPSQNNIESHGENKKLELFLNEGTGKAVDANNLEAEDIISTARKYLGVHHCMGGTSMKCVDCSGFVVAVFAAHGIHLPHNSEDLARYGKIIPGMKDLMKGDLVFFINSYKTSHFITHTGIYIGNNEFIHSSSGYGVAITSLSDPYWLKRFIFGTRLIR